MWLQATLLENLCIPMGDSQDYLSIHPTFKNYHLKQLFKINFYINFGIVLHLMESNG